MTITTVIFDLDGTLINSLKDLQISINYAIYRFKFPKQTVTMVRNNIGNGIEPLVERSIPDGRNNIYFEECLQIFREHYSKNMLNNTKPYPQILEMLVTLKTKGYKMGIASNKFDTAVQPLCRKYFRGLIDVAIGQNIDTKRKPAPDIIYILMDELNSTKDETILVGDSNVDILTAKNAGIKCVNVSWGYKTKEFLKENGAENIIDTPIEIFNYL